MRKLKNSIAYIILLPVFFILHGYNEFQLYFSTKELAVLLCWYWLFTAISFIIFRWLLKSNTKAALFTFALQGIQFFFGTVFDALVNSGWLSFLGHMTILLPITTISIIALLIFLKKKKHPSGKVNFFLNLLFTVLLLIEVGVIIHHGKPLLSKPYYSETINPPPIDIKNKPDIYFIITDEYAGEKELKELYGYDNSDLANYLQEKKFKTFYNYRSNYNFTPFSIASILNCKYIDGVANPKNINAEDYNLARSTIKNSFVIDYFRALQYQVINNSIFDIKEQPVTFNESFLPFRNNQIAEQTFIVRVKTSFKNWRLARKYPSVDRSALSYAIGALDYNNTTIENIKKQTLQHTNKPRFIYTHLFMPHDPLLFDSTGKMRDFDTIKSLSKANSSRGYLNYLPYTNSRIKEIIDAILKNNPTPPVILLMGDHGFRATGEQYEPYYFYPLNAIYIPNGNYNGFYDGMSHVNLFRILINNTFNEKYPLLKDSTILLKQDPGTNIHPE